MVRMWYSFIKLDKLSKGNNFDQLQGRNMVKISTKIAWFSISYRQNGMVQKSKCTNLGEIFFKEM